MRFTFLYSIVKEENIIQQFFIFIFSGHNQPEK